METPHAANDNIAFYEQFIDEGEAGAFLGFSRRAMQNWRLRGGGPKFVQVSTRSVRYRRRDLIAWAEARTFDSTSAYTD